MLQVNQDPRDRWYRSKEDKTWGHADLRGRVKGRRSAAAALREINTVETAEPVPLSSLFP